MPLCSLYTEQPCWGWQQRIRTFIRSSTGRKCNYFYISNFTPHSSTVSRLSRQVGSASALVIYSIRRLELVLGAEVSSIGFNLSLASEERNTISVSEGVSRLSMSCCKEANKKCPSLPHRWQYLVLMARLANQTRHWTYGGLGVSALDCRTTEEINSL